MEALPCFTNKTEGVFYLLGGKSQRSLRYTCILQGRKRDAKRSPFPHTLAHLELFVVQQRTAAATHRPLGWWVMVGKRWKGRAAGTSSAIWYCIKVSCSEGGEGSGGARLPHLVSLPGPFPHLYLPLTGVHPQDAAALKLLQLNGTVEGAFIHADSSAVSWGEAGTESWRTFPGKGIGAGGASTHPGAPSCPRRTPP